MNAGKAAVVGVAGIAAIAATFFLGTSLASSSQASASSLSVILGIPFVEGILMPMLSIIFLSSGLISSMAFCISFIISSISLFVGGFSFAGFSFAGFLTGWAYAAATKRSSMNAIKYLFIGIYFLITAVSGARLPSVTHSISR